VLADSKPNLPFQMLNVQKPPLVYHPDYWLIRDLFQGEPKEMPSLELGRGKEREINEQHLDADDDSN
jgi:hypothetical protein